jgi:hypothetical protein
VSLEYAAAEAIPGDTLIFVSGVLVAETVTFESGQTPLSLVSSKGTAGLSGIGTYPLLRFRAPRAGTRITQLAFGGGDPAVLVEGAGTLLVEDCTFSGGSVQVQATGNGATATVDGCLMENASLFSIRTEAGGKVTATSNTIVHAGDCGIYLGGGASTIRNCIIWSSARYAIACAGGSLASESGCNDTFASGTEEYLDCVPPESDFSVDPLFCDAPSGDYFLQVNSFCAPGNNPDCGLVGKYFATCQPPPPEEP